MAVTEPKRQSSSRGGAGVFGRVRRVVAFISRSSRQRPERGWTRILRTQGYLAAVFSLLTGLAHAAVLPEDRADLLYHSYDGGGVTVDGPSVLVRKDVADKVSLHANYYVDMVSSASIDVLTQGSPYSEERTEYTVGADYLADKALLSLSLTDSSESDYDAETVSFGISQPFFGELTTLTMGYSQGDDTIRKNDDPAFGEKWAKRRRFNVGISQILTKSWIVAANIETVVDDGFLRNPYRHARYLTPVGGEGDDAENYPLTRNSDALSFRSIYYLPYRAAIRLEARVFQDSWGITAQNYELRYTHPLSQSLILELKTRTYAQSDADFFQDIFAYEDQLGTEFRARDKELSTFDSFNLGLGVTYEFDWPLGFGSKESFSVFWDFMRFDYENFRDARQSRSHLQTGSVLYLPGEEPAYNFEANVVRAFLSVYF